MPSSLVAGPFSTAAFESFLSLRREPDWMLELRRRAWQGFESRAWPTPRDEEWMRTDVRLFKLDRFRLPEEASPLENPPPGLLSAGVDLAGSAVAHNGLPLASSLDPELQRQGVLFGSLDQLVAEHGDKIRPYLCTQAVKPELDRYSLLHTAAMSGSFLLYVPRNVVLSRPLHLHSLLGPNAADFSHTLVVLEEGAEATLLAESNSLQADAAGLHCGAVELIVGNGAKLRYVNLQDWGHGVWHFAHQKAVLGREASLQWTIGAVGSRLSKVNQHVALRGEGAECQVNGVIFTEGKQHISYHTLQHHEAPHTRSDLLYKGALQDASRIVWRGMIKVAKLAQKTDGYQRNDNLMLSTAARADSIPGLEIEADDVRCTHGSTNGKVDDELLFYAQCRGFTRQEATRMIVTGFLQQVFDRITIESVREALGSAIARRVREYA